MGATRALALVGLVLLAIPAARFLRGDLPDPRVERDLGELTGPARVPAESLAAAPNLLLVTTDRASGPAPFAELPRLTPAAVHLVGDVVAASPFREPALASLLTGQPVLSHRVLFDGGGAPPLDPTLAERLSHVGYQATVFGADGLPGWATLGATRRDAGLDAATGWLAERGGAPRFAHVHVAAFDARAFAAALRRMADVRTLVVATTIVGSTPDGSSASASRFLEGPSLAVELALVGVGLELAAPAARPRSACEIPALLLARAGAPSPDSLDDAAEPLVVSLAHGRDGRPHRLRARARGVILDLELTPLGGHPTDDWELVGPAASHLAYRNAMRVAPPGAAAQADEVLERLARWRDRHAAREWRPSKR